MTTEETQPAGVPTPSRSYQPNPAADAMMADIPGGTPQKFIDSIRWSGAAKHCTIGGRHGIGSEAEPGASLQHAVYTHTARAAGAPSVSGCAWTGNHEMGGMA